MCRDNLWGSGLEQRKKKKNSKRYNAKLEVVIMEGSKMVGYVGNEKRNWKCCARYGSIYIVNTGVKSGMSGVLVCTD
jgi:hypothetical protein